ncbi:SHIPPO_1-like protein [Hexamita inflata]|uniref:SHIPPO 1-like protein n=1 Tax=Hexamita inflata TaxID=28002 RepID=A0AA86UNU8_9EUKA|nr:SHIPPO 1-like protein [Hexamita inflata]
MSEDTLRLSSANMGGVQAFQRVSSAMGKLGKSYTYAEEAADSSFTPGIGSYNIQRSFSATSKMPTAFSLSSRHPEPQKNTNVGPGTYNVSLSNLNKFGACMAQAPRTITTHRSNTPEIVGPGSYRPQSHGLIDTKHGFTLSSRYSTHKDVESPGVGAYDILKANKTDFGKQTMQGRYTGFQNMYMQSSVAPGVGSYTIGKKEENKGFSFPRQIKTGVESTNPGVGAYNIKVPRSGAGVGTLGGRYKGKHF